MSEVCKSEQMHVGAAEEFAVEVVQALQLWQAGELSPAVGSFPHP